MPYKSKRNRRNITKNRGETTNPIACSPETPARTANAQPERIISARGAITATPNYPYLLKDLKWTGVVTGAIIVILIVAFLIFH